MWQSGAISSYTLQSFMPNSGIKGFPFLSGLVALVHLSGKSFHPKKVWTENNFQKKYSFTVSRKIPKNKGVIFEKDIKLNIYSSAF